MNEVHGGVTAAKRRFERSRVLDIEIHPAGRRGASSIARRSSNVPRRAFERRIEVRAYESSRAGEEHGSRRRRLLHALGHPERYGCRRAWAQEGLLVSVVKNATGRSASGARSAMGA